MMLRSLGDVFARVANVNIPDDEAEAMIEEAALKAAAEVRQHGRLMRANEVERIRSDREREGFQRIEAANSADALARANAGTKERQAELKAAEGKNGPRRGHSFGNMF